VILRELDRLELSSLGAVGAKGGGGGVGAGGVNTDVVLVLVLVLLAVVVIISTVAGSTDLRAVPRCPAGAGV